MWAKYFNAGQTCVAPDYLLVDARVHDELLGLIKEEVRRMFGEHPLDNEDYGHIVNAKHFARVRGLIDPDKVVLGGTARESSLKIEPTILDGVTPDDAVMQEEIFGPVITIYVYDDNKYEETLELCDRTSPYGLTGSIFARDRYAIDMAFNKLRYAAGNFYINDKPTGAVIAQQPFGGSRASGTNDKAGGPLNLIRWTNARCIKEALVPPTSYGYPFLGEK